MNSSVFKKLLDPPMPTQYHNLPQSLAILRFEIKLVLELLVFNFLTFVVQHDS